VGSDIEHRNAISMFSQEVGSRNKWARLITINPAQNNVALLSRPGVLAPLASFEPANWTLIRFQLWSDIPDQPSDGQAQSYGVGHVSTA